MKRKFCEHCQDYVSARTYRQHLDLYYDNGRGQWNRQESSGEESGDLSASEDNWNETASEGYLNDHEAPVVTESFGEASVSEQAFDGVSINNLEEEDRHLLHGWDDSDSENEFIYHERMPQDILEEVWDLASEDVETDFPQGQSQHPSVVGNNTSLSGQNFKDCSLAPDFPVPLVFIFYIV